jgi:hypothetical protein
MMCSFFTALAASLPTEGEVALTAPEALPAGSIHEIELFLSGTDGFFTALHAAISVHCFALGNTGRGRRERGGIGQIHTGREGLR